MIANSSLRETVHSAGNAGVATMWSEQVIPFLSDSLWLLILPIIIVLADLWFGVSESKQNKVEVRFSGAGWKTLRKLMDYYTVLCLGFVIAKMVPPSYGVSVQEVCFYFVALPSVFDLCSILGHILCLHGIKFDITKFILKMIRSKNEELGEAIDDSIKEIKETN